MSLHVTGRARLVTDPKHGRTTGSNKPWCNTVLRVSNWRKTDDGWEETDSYICTAVAFDEAAFALSRFAKGDEVEFAGRVRELKVWAPEGREARAQLGLALDDVHAPERKSRSRGGQPHISDQHQEQPRGFSGRPEKADGATVLTMPANRRETPTVARQRSPYITTGGKS